MISLSFVLRNVGPVFFRTPLQFFEVYRHLFMHSSIEGPTTAFHSSWGFWLDLDYFLVDLLVCLGSLSGCITQCWWPSFRWQTDGLTFDSRIFWYTEECMVDSLTARTTGPVATKQTKTSPLYCGVWQLVWGIWGTVYEQTSPLCSCLFSKSFDFFLKT